MCPDWNVFVSTFINENLKAELTVCLKVRYGRKKMQDEKINCNFDLVNKYDVEYIRNKNKKSPFEYYEAVKYVRGDQIQ